MLSTNAHYGVFIAYNSKDRPKVEEVVDLLKKNGIINPWYDQDITPNESWLDQLHEAIPKCASVAFLIGPNGLGRWQVEELNAVKKHAVEKRKIPVYLVMLSENLKIPDIFDTYFPFSNTFILKDQIKDSPDFKKLVDSINYVTKRIELVKNRFEIEVDVIEPNHGCFLSIPKIGYSNIFNLVKETFKEIKYINLFQNIRRDDPVSKYTEEDVFHIVRESELVISVCVPEKNSENASLEVIYELGLAHALGKPSIVITSNGQRLKDRIESFASSEIKAQPRIEFVKYDSGDEDKFVCDLKTKIEEITSKLTDPYLVYPDVEGIRAFRPDMAYYKSSILPHFYTILSFGISMIKNFSNIAHQCYVLANQNENLVQIKDENVGKGITQPNQTFIYQYKVFRQGCQTLLENHEEWKTNYLNSLGTRRAEIDRAFNSLQPISLGDLQKYVDKSRKYYNNVFEENNCYIKSYLDNFTFIQERMKESTDITEIWPEVEKEKTEIELVKKYLKFIDGAIHNMMDELLKFIIND